MYETNLKKIDRRIRTGLAMLREHYDVKELPVKDVFRSFYVAGRRHVVRHFEIVGVGNLVIMTNPDAGAMQMDTFTITPYFKNLPLFTTDYMYFEDKIAVLNEIYDLVPFKDDLYEKYIARFAANVAEYEDLDPMPLRPCWYDEIRPVVASYFAKPDQFEDVYKLFIKNLSTFIQMEKETPLLPEDQLQAKWDQNYRYARSLVEDGGVSTELFVKSLGADETKEFFYNIFFGPDLYRPDESVINGLDRVLQFFEYEDENGIANLDKIRERQKIIRRVETTDKNKSFEDSEDQEFHQGFVTENGKLTGFGIHIYNEDVYPLQSFEIYLRNCDLQGSLDLSSCRDMVFLDVYHNKISGVETGFMPAMRIFGIQDNLIETLNVKGMPACQGIDAGCNHLKELNVSKNHELVELYINDNCFTEIDLSHNHKLKYFYCHNNRITELDTRHNPILRHLNATGNPMKKILACAPQSDGALPLEIYAGKGGSVGLKFNPVYNAQWKETGEWQQSYYAYPEEGHGFIGWFDEKDALVSTEESWIDAYGTSRILTARFL